MGRGAAEGQVELRQDEAVLLAHALVARLAERAGARVLFIKGPTAVAIGVRPPRASSDVDVLVEPASFDAMCRAMESAEWRMRTWLGALRYAGDFAFDHSAHFIHPEWPCDVDVHYNFPGFLADPAVVFDALWAGRTDVQIAEQQMPSPGLAGHAMVVALHALRDPQKPQSQADLAYVTTVADRWVPAAKDEIAELASVTGAADSAAPLLVALGGVRTACAPSVNDPALARRLAEWHARQRGFGRSTMWLVELHRAPWCDKPATLRRALIPPRHYLIAAHQTGALTTRRLLLLHLRRWGRGLASMPGALARASRLR